MFLTGVFRYFILGDRLKGVATSFADGLTIVFTIVMIGLMFLSILYTNTSTITLVSVDEVKYTENQTRIVFTIRHPGGSIKIIGVEVIGIGNHVFYGSNGFSCSRPPSVIDTSLKDICDNPPLVSTSSFYLILDGKWNVEAVRVYYVDDDKIYSAVGYRYG